MNILYIGPYRLNTDYGYESLNILLNLQDSFPNILSRSLYNESSIHKLEDSNLLLSRLESKTLKNFDLFIQNTSLESMTYTTRIKKHIFLPILNSNIMNYTQKQIIHKLQQHGLFLTCRNRDDFILKDAGVLNKRSYKLNIHNRLSPTSSGSFNLGLYSSYKKYYSIVSSKDQNSIKQLIVNYITQIKDPNSCLLLFMQDVNPSTLDEYNKYIKNVYKAMNINYSISKVVVVPIQLDNKNIPAIHSGGDIYININDNIHSLYAYKYQKPIISNKSQLSAKYDYISLYETPKIYYKDDIDLSQIDTNENPNPSLVEVISNYV